MFRVHKIGVIFDEKYFSEVWIDPHYEEKHASSITDELILVLLLQIRGKPFIMTKKTLGFTYYEVKTELEHRLYKMILVVPDDFRYLGVRNTFRRSK